MRRARFASVRPSTTSTSRDRSRRRAAASRSPRRSSRECNCDHATNGARSFSTGRRSVRRPRISNWPRARTPWWCSARIGTIRHAPSRLHLVPQRGGLMTCFVDSRTSRCLAVAVAASVAVTLNAQSPEELARRTLESGRAFMRSQNYGEAVKDFESVLQRYPTSAVADDALLELATYQLQVVRDAAAA